MTIMMNFIISFKFKKKKTKKNLFFIFFCPKINNYFQLNLIIIIGIKSIEANCGNYYAKYFK